MLGNINIIFIVAVIVIAGLRIWAAKVKSLDTCWFPKSAHFLSLHMYHWWYWPIYLLDQMLTDSIIRDHCCFCQGSYCFSPASILSQSDCSSNQWIWNAIQMKCNKDEMQYRWVRNRFWIPDKNLLFWGREGRGARCGLNSISFDRMHLHFTIGFSTICFNSTVYFLFVCSHVIWHNPAVRILGGPC